MKYAAVCPDCQGSARLSFNSSAERNHWMTQHAERTMHNPKVVNNA
jgi:hypothetical protein